MSVIESKNVVMILSRTLNGVDTRLISHGERVAFIVAQVLKDWETASEKDKAWIPLAGLLHDVGAYKVEDIDKMLLFEGNDVWPHAIYGYLFLKYFAPFQAYADLILYHHLKYNLYDDKGVPEKDSHYSGLIFLADRLDILSTHHDRGFCRAKLKKAAGTGFSPVWVDAMLAADEKYHIIQRLQDGSYQAEVRELFETMEFTAKERSDFLSMIAYAIDFRSEFMVRHTVTTVCVTGAIAELMGLPVIEKRKLHYGALLHDLGKIKCPMEILEKAGPLTEEEMELMQKHVVWTREILDGLVDEEIMEMACRHHEKLDGSGYPDGLGEDVLTDEMQVVAIADIFSALVSRRSYKQSFSKESTIGILQSMKNQDKISARITDLVCDNFDKIIKSVEVRGREIQRSYEAIQEEFGQISKHMA